MRLNIIQKAFQHYGEFYETRQISKTRKVKTCHICFRDILPGSSTVDYKFYGEYGDFPSATVCMRCETTYDSELKDFKIHGIPSDLEIND